jgi:hypothetical protein
MIAASLNKTPSALQLAFFASFMSHFVIVSTASKSKV